MSYHIFSYINWNKFFTIVNRKSVTYKIWKYC